MSKTKNSTVLETPSLAPGISYRNPAPNGVPVKTTIERGNAYLVPKLYNVEITLMEVLRGEEALERIKADGNSIKSPKDGFEYVLARINFGYFRKTRGGEDEPYELPKGQFVAVDPDGVTEYEIPSVAKYQQPELIGYTFRPGESREGWVLLQVPKNTDKPLLIYKRQHIEGMYGIWSYVWFHLFNK